MTQIELVNEGQAGETGAGVELERARDALRRSNRRLESLLDGISDGFLVVDTYWRITYLNRQAGEMLKPIKDPQALVGKVLWDEFPAAVGSEFEAGYRRALGERVTTETEAFFEPLGKWFSARAYPTEDGLSIFFHDVTPRKQAELRLATERSILSDIAAGSPLQAVLERIAREAEHQSVDGMLCSILLLDDAGRQLLHGAAPSLPQAYNEAIHGLQIGPGVGSCGTAAFEKRRVDVGDTASHPYWINFRDLALSHGLRACCSTPVIGRDGHVLGTIAMYYRKPWQPSDADSRVIELAARLSAIAIERDRYARALVRSEQFNRGVIESSRDCIKTLTLQGELTWISAAGARALCVEDASSVVGKSYIDLWAEPWREKARAAVAAAAAGDSGSFAGCFPVRGEQRWWDVVITPVRDSSGRPERLLAVSRDITDRVEAEAEARASAEQLQQLANLIPQLAWMARPDGHIFWYNERWYEYTGTTPAQMQGWGWQSVHDPAVLPSVLERWRHSLASGTAFEMEFPLKGADGVFRWFLTRVHPMRGADGQVTRWFGTNTDVDNVRRIRQALEEERRSLELLNEAGTALVETLDLQALLQKITDSATQLSGAQFGAFFYNVVHDNGEAYQLYTLSGAPREAFEKLGHPRATALFGPTFRGEGIIRCDDVLADPRYGQWTPHRGMPPGHLPVRSYLAVPVVSGAGEVLGGLFFGHPSVGVFTERIERLLSAFAAQAAIAVDNARLYAQAQKAADERKLLLESERHARSSAERAARMKDEFLATLSHELRTPLNAMLGWTNVLRLKPATSKEDLRKGLDAIERNARMQAQLIEDLLDMSRIASGKLRLELEDVGLRACVEAALETVRPSAEAKEIRLEIAGDSAGLAVRGDAARLQQVAWNLVSNAVKFTPQGGAVQVTVRAAGDWAEFTVADTGQGIDPQFLEQVFERFRQADASTTRQYGGLGLGLAIVKNLVELHGGTVEAHSAGRGQGSTFTVRLPRVAAGGASRGEYGQAAARAAIDFRVADLSRVKILVVDDHDDARELICRVLRECNAEVVEATGAQQALALLQRERPHVLVSDIGMPEMDGFQLLARVRALGAAAGGDLPAIALTAFARPEDRDRALRAGFVFHVAKPLEATELVSMVARCVHAPAAGSPSPT